MPGSGPSSQWKTWQSASLQGCLHQLPFLCPSPDGCWMHAFFYCFVCKEMHVDLKSTVWAGWALGSNTAAVHDLPLPA